MGHKSVNPRVFFLKNGSLWSPDIGEIIFYYCILRFFYSLPVKTSPISAYRRIVFMIYKYPYYRCEKKTLLKTPFTKTYKHR